MVKKSAWSKDIKIAIVTDWLTTYGGAEKVVKAVSDIFPDAPIFTSQYSEKEVDWFKNCDVRTGWMNIFPAKLRKILPIFRLLYFSSINLKKYDIIISICCAESKGIKTTDRQLHISYLQGPPTQYYWGMYDQYVSNPGFGKFNGLVRFFFKIFVAPLKKADFNAAQRPDIIIANSSYSAAEIKKYYQRDAIIIFPPVEISKFKYNPKKEDYFISTSRQVNWKRLDLAVRVFKETGHRLLLVGNGAEHNNLVNLAQQCDNIEFIETIHDTHELSKIVSSARGFIFPSQEPFGIAPIEALATGTPVIAFKEGGALDYIEDHKNGIFFDQQTVASLKQAVEEFNKIQFNTREVSASVNHFSQLQFSKNFKKIVKEAYAGKIK